MVYCGGVFILDFEIEDIFFNFWFKVVDIRDLELGCGYGVL